MDAARTNAGNAVGQLSRFTVLFLLVGLMCWVCLILPPWRSCLVLAVGSATAVSLNARKRRRAACFAATFTGLLCLGSLYPFVSVRAATPEDEIYERYFGAPYDREFHARNFAVVSGDFTLKNWVVGRLYYVEEGSITKLNQFGVGRTPNQIPRAVWERRQITIALVDYATEQGRVTQLASAGQNRGGGSGGEIPTSVNVEYAEIVTGPLLAGWSRLLYVEGDSPIVLRRGETIESFAANHKGKFHVVEVGFE